MYRGLIGVVYRTTKKRLSRQSQNAANCLMSDSDSSDDKQLSSLNAKDVDVDDDCPTKVDLLSCNSSFSDCSLPCHELVTYSERCSPLPEGVVKVSVRPPQCLEPCVYCGPCGPCLCVPCTDRDRYDIKFVSHIVDRPNFAKVRRITRPFEPPPSISSSHPPPSSMIIPPAPSPVVPSVSEETISVPTIISEPPPVVEEIPSVSSPPPSSPVISTPSVVEPGVLGVSGTQVVTRSRKHYGDLCKLIRCSKPCRPRCPPCRPPCELPPPSPCECCIPYEPCDHSVPCDSGNQSNSCSACPPCEPCCPNRSYCDGDAMCDPCRPPCEPCPPPLCCKPPPPPPPPCCRPCCKVTWVRSITAKPVRFIYPMILKKMLWTCDCEEPSSTTQASKQDQSTSCPDDDDTKFCCPCKTADPWKRPPGMEERTFERHVEEIVRTLEPAIPANPFSVPRESSATTDPDCDSVRVELERLLAAVDDPPDSCPCTPNSYPCTPTAVRSGCWPC